MGLILAFGLAWLAEKAGSAMILGAFAAGLLLSSAPRVHEIERGITALGHFFVPLFFVGVGASVDLRSLSPVDQEGRWALLVGLALIVVGCWASSWQVMPHSGSRGTRQWLGWG